MLLVQLTEFLYNFPAVCIQFINVNSIAFIFKLSHHSIDCIYSRIIPKVCFRKVQTNIFIILFKFQLLNHRVDRSEEYLTFKIKYVMIIDQFLSDFHFRYFSCKEDCTKEYAKNDTNCQVISEENSKHCHNHYKNIRTRCRLHILKCFPIKSTDCDDYHNPGQYRHRNLNDEITKNNN